MWLINYVDSFIHHKEVDMELLSRMLLQVKTLLKNISSKWDENEMITCILYSAGTDCSEKIMLLNAKVNQNARNCLLHKVVM